MIVVIDNYDSFTFNLVQYLGELRAEVQVYAHDAISVQTLAALQPEGVVISPGPGLPKDAGISLDVVHALAGRIPLLGVCLGHQAIGEAFGAKLVRSPRLMHGRTSAMHHEGKGMFRQLPSPFMATRYHSWMLDASCLGEALELTAWTDHGEVMGVRHRSLAVEGVQFHPESFLSEQGLQLLQNWLHTLPGRGQRGQEVAA